MEDDGAGAAGGTADAGPDAKTPFRLGLLSGNLRPVEGPDALRLGEKLQVAMMGIGALGGVSGVLGGAVGRLAPYLMGEAVTSSMIEGASTSLNDLFRYRVTRDIAGEEADRMTLREVDNNAHALEYSLERVGSGDRITADLLRDIHRELFRDTGYNPSDTVRYLPGEFRRQQNWIGKRLPGGKTHIVYTPPPPEMVDSLMENLVEYIGAGNGLESSLVRCAVAHYQFEAIHAFPDGNGRVGRILIALMMHKYRILQLPILNLSEYFFDYRDTYLRLLRNVSYSGEWFNWIDFFLDACIAQADIGVRTMKQFASLRQEYASLMQGVSSSAKAASLVDQVLENPYITVPLVSKITGLTPGGASNLVQRAVRVGILKRVPTTSKTGLYVAHKVLAVVGGGGTGERGTAERANTPGKKA